MKPWNRSGHFTLFVAPKEKSYLRLRDQRFNRLSEYILFMLELSGNLKQISPSVFNLNIYPSLCLNLDLVDHFKFPEGGMGTVGIWKLEELWSRLIGSLLCT